VSPAIRPPPRRPGGCPAKAAGKINRAANANGRMSSLLPCDVSGVNRAIVAQRVGEAVGRIDAGLNLAKQRGDLSISFTRPRCGRAGVWPLLAAHGELSRSLMLSVFAE
jgi:hypothetical protein